MSDRKFMVRCSVVFICVRVHSVACIDMFRYDSCCPANEYESGLLEVAFRMQEATWVVLRRFAPYGGRIECTSGRSCTLGGWRKRKEHSHEVGN